MTRNSKRGVSHHSRTLMMERETPFCRSWMLYWPYNINMCTPLKPSMQRGSTTKIIIIFPFFLFFSPFKVVLQGFLLSLIRSSHHRLRPGRLRATWTPFITLENAFKSFRDDDDDGGRKGTRLTLFQLPIIS